MQVALQTAVYLVVGAEGRVGRMLCGEELPVVEQVVPGLEEARENVELEDGDVAWLAQLYGGAQLGRLLGARDPVRQVELALELRPGEAGALGAHVRPPKVGRVLLGDPELRALVHVAREQRAQLGQRVREHQRELGEFGALFAARLVDAFAYWVGQAGY